MRGGGVVVPSRAAARDSSLRLSRAMRETREGFVFVFVFV